MSPVVWSEADLLELDRLVARWLDRHPPATPLELAVVAAIGKARDERRTLLAGALMYAVSADSAGYIGPLFDAIIDNMDVATSPLDSERN